MSNSMRNISFGFRTAHNFLQRESFPGRDRRTVPYQNRIVYAEKVSIIVDEVFLAPGDALAGLCIDDPTRDSDGCSLVHEASLCDDAQEGHGRHIESCEEVKSTVP